MAFDIETIDILLPSVNEYVQDGGQIIITHDGAVVSESVVCEGGTAERIHDVLYTSTAKITRICTCSGCGSNLLFPES